MRTSTTASTPADHFVVPSDLPNEVRKCLTLLAQMKGQADHTTSPDRLVEMEKLTERLSAEIGQIFFASTLQEILDSPAVQANASALVESLPRRYRVDESRATVGVRTALGAVVSVATPYYRQKGGSSRRRKPGLYPVLALLGIWDRCTPKLASDVSRSVAMLGSIDEARAHLLDMGIELGVKPIRSISYVAIPLHWDRNATTGRRHSTSVFAPLVPGRPSIVGFENSASRPTSSVHRAPHETWALGSNARPTASQMSEHFPPRHRRLACATSAGFRHHDRA